MVDLRPLLFVNFLMVLLFASAGFVWMSNDALSDRENTVEPVAHSQPEIVETDDKEKIPESTSSIEEQQNTANDLMGLLAQKPKYEDLTPNAALQAEESGEGSAPESKPQTTTGGEQVDEADAIFADQLADTESSKVKMIETKPVAKVIETNPAPDSPVAVDTPQVISYENKPSSKPVIPTGTLTVHSNIYEDTVLINGKPYGSTKLEVKLTPGSYTVEVAKEGYSSWKTEVDIRKGTNKVLKAQLEYYTKVEYVNGEWRNGIRTGAGNYVEPGSIEYDGSFVNGKFHGQGSARYVTGLKYQGAWAEGKMHGNGTLTTPEGDTYIGEMENDKFNGDGTLTKANGDIYSGYWIDGALSGQGTLTTKDGMLYVGGFSDNQFHGSGTLTYPDGGYYEGSFSNGLYHGKGTEIYANGKKYAGQFIEGLYHGKGEMMNPNGSKITGTFKNGEPFGQATLTTEEGEIFTARSSEPGVCYRLKSYRATKCPELEGW